MKGSQRSVRWLETTTRLLFSIGVAVFSQDHGSCERRETERVIKTRDPFFNMKRG